MYDATDMIDALDAMDEAKPTVKKETKVYNIGDKVKIKSMKALKATPGYTTEITGLGYENVSLGGFTIFDQMTKYCGRAVVNTEDNLYNCVKAKNGFYLPRIMFVEE